MSSSRDRSKNRQKLPQQGNRRLRVEQLEDRRMLAILTVSNLNDTGNGSLRQAITTANQASGADTIDFSVDGTIQLASALPQITGEMNINGASAPNYGGTPEVEIDFHGNTGLVVGAGAAGTTIGSLSMVNASGSGVTLSNTNTITLDGNYIGLALDGETIDANTGDGISLVDSLNDIIGGTIAAQRNVISGNGNNGITLTGSSTNTIEGNYLGLDALGAIAKANAANGVQLFGVSNGNTVGGTVGNVISGNLENGVLINGSSTGNTVAGNTVGLAANGTTIVGNRLDGVDVSQSTGNTIGNTNPVSSVDYTQPLSVTTSGGTSEPISAWQGIRAGSSSGQYIMTGTSNLNGLLYEGTMAGVGTGYLVNYPSSQTTTTYNTSVYGPNNLGGGELQLVGVYKNTDYQTAPVTVNGFLYQGTTAGLSDPNNYTTIDYPGATYTYLHSTMGGMIVGNYDNPGQHGEAGLPFGPGNAFVYDIATGSYTSITYPGALSNSAYGIWWNGGTSYTIVGGYSLTAANNFADQDQPIGQAYMVDYNSTTGTFSNWTSFSDPGGVNSVTHFEGISSPAAGVYTLSADSGVVAGSGVAQGSVVTVVRNADGSFGTPTWANLNYTGTGAASGQVTSSNSIAGNQVVGVVSGSGGVFAYQATVNEGFQLSNVISGNGGNGVELNAANNNNVAMNYIGTDASGNVAKPNGANGVLITAGASANLIGGEATGGNDPTNGVFVRPPEGNLISGNAGDGVEIDDGATDNQLSGNFIGTKAGGSSALGNHLDGVNITDANDNSLLGCNFTQNPFVFYNVISGNGGNGLMVYNSNNTTIQANFFGVGADNMTAVGNTLNGVLIAGSSTNTTMGGPIPLGNVDAANGQNGIVVQDTASFFTSYNTFTGVAAFSLQTNLGNGRDGMLITSTGGSILIRTCVVSENGNDGIEIGGSATGVDVVGNIIGLNTNGLLPMGNKNNGVEVDGNASGDVIGGPQPTFNVVPQNAIGANWNNGIAIDGNAHNIKVSNSFIGTDVTGKVARGNGNSGIYVGPGTYGNTIGSADPTLPTVISGNNGNGIQMIGSTDNAIVGSWIGVDSTGTGALGNGGNAIFLQASSNNTIGTTSLVAAQNVLANNGANGIFIRSGSSDGIFNNSIYANGSLGISLGSGANLDQPAPVVTVAQSAIGGPLIAGLMIGTQNTKFTVQFFGNTNSGPSGKVFLGSTTVTTNGSGLGVFVFVGTVLPSGTTFVTATATDPINNTSQFSAAQAVST